MTATAPGQPSTPAQALRWAADRFGISRLEATDSEAKFAYTAAVGLLRRWADELDPGPAAPSTYALPAEPDVPELWEVRTGRRWERQEFPGYVRWRSEESDGDWKVWPYRQFHELLARGPLSTVPPAGTEPADDCLRTAAEVRARGRERCDHCAYPAGERTMSDRRWTDADRDLVAEALYRADWPDETEPWDSIVAAYPIVDMRYRPAAEVVLDALTAAGWRRDADVRAEVAEEIAQAIDAQFERANSYHGRAALMRAAETARGHRNPPTDRTEGDRDAG